GGISMMQIHVATALGSLPLAVWHVVARPVRARRTDLSRRRLLRAAALLGGAVAAYATLEGVVAVTGLPGRSRRFTGSYERASFEGNAMPVTQWLDDSVPIVGPSEWSLVVKTSGGERRWTLGELSLFGDRASAALDCTG